MTIKTLTIKIQKSCDPCAILTEMGTPHMDVVLIKLMLYIGEGERVADSEPEHYLMLRSNVLNI